MENNNTIKSGGDIRGNPDDELLKDLGDLVSTEGVTNTDVLNMYDKYASTYEQHMDDIEFSAAALACQYYDKHATRIGLGTDGCILDVGAGAGKIGKLMKSRYGYKTIDAVDPCEKMLAIAEKSGHYRHCFLGKVGGGHTIPAKDNSYDGAVVAGCLLPGHMPYDAFLEMIRVVKPGGLIVNSMREEFTWQNAECDVRAPFSQWELEGKWHVIEWAIPDQKYFNEQDALIHVYRVC